MNQLDELRQIIVGDNSERLDELKGRIEDIDLRTRDVAEVLAPAIDANVKQDDRLIDALKRPVSEGLKQAIRIEPEVYAEILYPAIAPSIRAAISQAISSMLATINQTIESATSVDSLRLRAKSWRTGIPYSELLLQQSLLYRVEHLYLIDRESGLLLAEVGSEHGSLLDSDAVSAMFSAIQSFVQDSFSGDQEDRLTDFKVGSHNVWLAHGPHAMLACVIFGNAPESLKNQLYRTLEDVRLKYSSQLANYSGDSSELEGVDEYLQPMMQVQLREEEEDVSAVSFGSKLVYLALTLLLLYWIFTVVDKRSKLAAVNYHLDAAPGIVVTKSAWKDDVIVVDGLQDPDAKLPIKTLSAFGINESNVRLNMTPFRSLEVEMEIRRFRNELDPPASVQLQITNGNIALSGQAPLGWLLQHDLRLRQLATDKRLNIEALYTDRDSVDEYLVSALGLPRQPTQEKILAVFSETPWIDISFNQVMRDLLRNSRR